jgi:hypothetical protein
MALPDWLIHYGNRGVIGETVNFNPDNNNNGLWIEGSHADPLQGRESAGIFMNGNTIALWSPGDNDLLKIYDEDSLPGGNPLLKVVDTGQINEGQTVLFVFVNGQKNGIGTASLQQVKVGDANSGGAPGFRMLRVEMP